MKQSDGRSSGPPWRVESKDTLLENAWFSVLHQKVRKPCGTISDYYTLGFAGPSVGVIARRGDSYLLIHQYRFIVDEYVWAIPSGGVDKGETPAEAARRELIEETGYRASRIVHLFGYYPSYGATDQRFELFLADGVEESDTRFDPNETLGVGWFSRAQVIEMIVRNQIVDGLSLTPLAVLFLREELEACQSISR
jgi:8-oxo-dGTP pyrophosphatase MutT (NUDIX family)